MVDLKVVAVEFLDRGLPWPDHNNEHTRTIARDRMMDSTCLRCVLESTLEAQAKERHEALLKSPPKWRRETCF